MTYPRWPGSETELLPAIVQHARTKQVLMLAYMNREALERTVQAGRVTFYSRSRETLWTKGESSGNTLTLIGIELDCDSDTFLVQALPAGPTCHLGTTSCFGTSEAPGIGFLPHLADVIRSRRPGTETAVPNGSYTAQLFEQGLARIAQKVGEESVETVIAAVAGDRAGLVGESADLIYHWLVLLEQAGVPLEEVLATLRARHAAPTQPAQDLNGDAWETG